jgi:hypothetical protein
MSSDPFADHHPTDEFVICAKRRKDHVFTQVVGKIDNTLDATLPSDDEPPVRAGTNCGDPPCARFHPSSPSIEPDPFRAEPLDIFLSPLHGLGCAARVARPRLEGVDRDDGPKSSAFDVEVRREMIVGIYRDFAIGEAADRRHDGSALGRRHR